MDRNPMIVMEHVSYRRPGQQMDLFSGFSLQIYEGEWICIVGANGSGKSTLIRLMNGLLPADGGSIRIDGIELHEKSMTSIRRKIGMVFANPDNQFVGLTVADDIVFGLENQCLPREEMDRRLLTSADQLQLTDLLDRHPGQLSGGQKQRAAIAGVLAMKPSIVIFDEATSMLDERTKHDLITLMKEMQSSGQYTIITISHDHDEMLASDRIIALHNGEIIADGYPMEVLQQEEVLKKCRIRPPFIVKLLNELSAGGMEIDVQTGLEEVVEDLWGLSLHE